MEAQLQREAPQVYRSILVAADSSDHAGRGAAEAVELAGLWDAKVTGTHVYAAKMHDARFRQMEGGLPEQFQQEQELERQRDVHDDLITRGLSIITDSYLDQVEGVCKRAAVRFARRSLEGKNYRGLVREANSGHYDLLVMGALGVGAIEGSRLGTVCQRVVRRANIDTLVIKEPRRTLAEGPIVVAVDGSERAYGGLLTALSLAGHWQVPVQVVAAFDPYYHYVAFNRIAGVLSEEAGKVFRFQEQEKLHEDIIDSGLAKIYQGHLTVAADVASDYSIEVETVLLDGKPHDAIEKHLRKVKPSLLVIGKLGIHADPELDIGGNAERLLSHVDCAVWLSQHRYQPRVEQVAEVTTSWTKEAERRMERVPSFVRDMARMAILRYAQERGHTVITERLVEEATAQLMPGRALQAMGEIVDSHDPNLAWSEQAKTLLDTVTDSSLRDNLGLRAEKKARAEGVAQVEEEHVKAFLDENSIANPDTTPYWQAAALALLQNIPHGFCRTMTKKAAETLAAQSHLAEIDEAFLRQVMQTFEAGAKAATETMPWDEEARGRIAKAPEMVRGMLTREIEAWSQRNGMERVSHAAVDAVKREWQQRGVFHLDPNDPRSGDPRGGA